jgi:type VI protein secretion system component VasA
MATDFTPEEIQRIFAEYNDAIKTGTPITKEMADRFRDAQKGVKGFTAQMEATTKALGKSTVDFTKAMYKGEQSATAMNSAVDTLTSGIQLLINLIPGFRLAKIALTALTLAVGGATKAVNAQTEALFKSYQDMAQFGAGAAGGMRLSLIHI